MTGTELMKKMAETLKAMLPEGFGFTILVFPLNRVGYSNYISTAQRTDMIKVLRETADRLEANETVHTPGSN